MPSHFMDRKLGLWLSLVSLGCVLGVLDVPLAVFIVIAAGPVAAMRSPAAQLGLIGALVLAVALAYALQGPAHHAAALRYGLYGGAWLVLVAIGIADRVRALGRRPAPSVES